MLSTLLIAALLAGPQEAAPEESFEELFLPAFEYRTRSVEQWMTLGEHGRLTERALWCLFYRDDRSPAVLDLLREQLALQTATRSTFTTAGFRNIRREIDAVLDHWQVEHECLELDEYFSRPPERLGPPADLLEGSDEELVDRLQSGDLELRARAALTLVARQRHVREALRAIVRGIQESGTVGQREGFVFEAFDRAWGYAGSEAEQGLAELLADSDEALELQLFLLDRISLRRPERAVARDDRALPRVLAELAEGGPLAGSARRELWALFDLDRFAWGPDPFEEWTSHWIQEYGEPLDRPEAERWLARAAVATLADPQPGAISEIVERHVAESSVEPAAAGELAWELQKLHGLQVVVLRSRAVLDAVRPLLLDRIRRSDLVGLEALRLLCHAGEGGPEVRAAYLRTLSALDVEDPLALARIPCLQHHDADTRAAFERVFERASAKEHLNDALIALGERDLNARLGRTYAAHLDAGGVQTHWRSLYEKGFHGEVEVQPGDDRFTRVNKLGLRGRQRLLDGLEPTEQRAELWRILEEEGAATDGASPVDDYSQAMWVLEDLGLDEPRFADWGIRFLAVRPVDNYGYHKAAAVEILSRLRTPLTRRQQAALCQGDHDDYFDQFWPLLADQGVASIEAVVDIREAAYRWSVEYLRPVLRITRLSRLDEELLLSTLRWGRAEERELVLELVRELELDTSDLREAVRERVGDCDERVRALAGRIVASRGW